MEVRTREKRIDGVRDYFYSHPRNYMLDQMLNVLGRSRNHDTYPPSFLASLSGKQEETKPWYEWEQAITRLYARPYQAYLGPGELPRDSRWIDDVRAAIEKHTRIKTFELRKVGPRAWGAGPLGHVLGEQKPLDEQLSYLNNHDGIHMVSLMLDGIKTRDVH